MSNFLHSLVWSCVLDLLVKILVLRDRRFSCCRAMFTLSQAPHAALAVTGEGEHRKWGKDTARTTDPHWPKHDHMQCSAKKLGIRKRKGGEMLAVMPFVFRKKTLTTTKKPVMYSELCFHGSSWTSACWQEIVTDFTLLFCLCRFVLCLVNCLYFKPWVLTFKPFQFSSCTTNGSE